MITQELTGMNLILRTIKAADNCLTQGIAKTKTNRRVNFKLYQSGFTMIRQSLPSLLLNFEFLFAVLRLSIEL